MGEKKYSEELLRFVICRLMHWDFYTYESQPPFFIDEIVLFLSQEAARDKNRETDVQMKSQLNTSLGEVSRHG